MFNKIECTCCFRLRPLAFGLALGITAMLMMILMMFPLTQIWGMGASLQVDVWQMGFVTAFVGFAKGFLFGIVSALFYNLFVCCCRKCNSTAVLGDGCAKREEPKL